MDLNAIRDVLATESFGSASSGAVAFDATIENELTQLDSLYELGERCGKVYAQIRKNGYDPAAIQYLNTTYLSAAGLNTIDAVDTADSLVALEGIMSGIGKAFSKVGRGIANKSGALARHVQAGWMRTKQMMTSLEAKLRGQHKETKLFKFTINREFLSQFGVIQKRLMDKRQSLLAEIENLKKNNVVSGALGKAENINNTKIKQLTEQAKRLNNDIEWAKSIRKELQAGSPSKGPAEMLRILGIIKKGVPPNEAAANPETASLFRRLGQFVSSIFTKSEGKAAAAAAA